MSPVHAAHVVYPVQSMDRMYRLAYRGRMAFPVGDESTSRPEAAHCGTECEPDPELHPADAANEAEDNARRAVDGKPITGRRTDP